MDNRGLIPDSDVNIFFYPYHDSCGPANVLSNEYFNKECLNVNLTTHTYHVPKFMACKFSSVFIV
jgi:hypothetical protein